MLWEYQIISFLVEISIQDGIRKPYPAIFYDRLLKLSTDAKFMYIYLL